MSSKIAIGHKVDSLRCDIHTSDYALLYHQPVTIDCCQMACFLGMTVYIKLVIIFIHLLFKLHIELPGENFFDMGIDFYTTFIDV